MYNSNIHSNSYILKVSVLFLLFLITSAFCSQNKIINDNDVNVLVILPANYGANYYLNLNRFEEFGWNVATTGLNSYVNPCPAFAGPLGCPYVFVDTLLSELENFNDFDGIVIMAASYWADYNPCSDLIQDPHTLNLITSAVDSGKVIGAWCSGVRVLAAANVLNGVDVTGSWRFSQEYTNAGANWVGANHYPVIDNNIMTCAIIHINI